MPKTVLWLIIIFSILFIIGVNTGEVAYLMNLGSTIWLACIGVGWWPNFPVTDPDPGGVGFQRLYAFPCGASMIYPGPFWGLSMPKKIIGIIIIFTVFFTIGFNSGDLTYLLNLGSTICVFCIGVG